MRVRVGLQMTDKLLKEVDEMALQMNLSRSSFVSMALTKYIQQEKVMNVLPDFVEVARKEQEKSKLSSRQSMEVPEKGERAED